MGCNHKSSKRHYCSKCGGTYCPSCFVTAEGCCVGCFETEQGIDWQVLLEGGVHII